jgi:hypothetical protein
MTITRRAACRLLCAAGAATLAPRGTTAQQVASYNVQGTGPVLITFDRAPRGYFDALTSPAFIDTFTADRVSDDILAVADAVGAFPGELSWGCSSGFARIG